MPASQPAFYNNISVSGGPPVRAYIEELLPDILEGMIEPGRVFDRGMEPFMESRGRNRWQPLAPRCCAPSQSVG
jgi:hypothetical protein